MKKASHLLSHLFTILIVLLVGASAVPNLTPAGLPGSYFVSESSYPSVNVVAAPPLLVPPSPAGEYIVVIVESPLYSIPAVQTAVTTYVTDLNNTGYNTILYTTAIATVQNLRTLLQNWYTTYNIIGAVLIGNLPFAWYYHPPSSGFSADTFICDLFLMDLDGLWWDLNIDTVYDKHNASTGDIYPEIFVARIDASTRTLGGASNANNIIMLLNRIHTYRTGGVARTHRAITYIDDDWQSWADGTVDNWPAWLNNVYPTRTDVHTPASWTNATDWLTNRITQDYEWAHLCAHSDNITHYFGPGGWGEGTVSSAQIHAQVPTFNFYNLFSCHAANWVAADCLATTYLFSGSHSLAVIGSTKTGGMLGGTSFYNALGQNDTIGEAFETWFQGITGYSGQYVEWFYGMTILGDPLLTTHYDITALPPVISSATHPDQTLWYGSGLPQFTWTTPTDVNGISGYYYLIDQSPTTVPTSTTGTYTTLNTFTPSVALGDGTWYFHVVTNDSVGNIGTEAAHYQVNIDATGPTCSITSHTTGSIIGRNITLVWSVSDTGTGVNRSEVYLDSILNQTVYYPTTQLSFIGLPLGTHLLNVTAYDELGQTGSDQIVVTVLGITIPPIPGFPIEAIALGAILAVGVGLVSRRRKQHQT
ncbi:MAG: hypothetical protein ACFE89_03695 [Candidatus Hodarchaeota archaeon]